MLSSADAQTLLNSGFIQEEVEYYANAKTPSGADQEIDLSTHTWQATITSRREWVTDRLVQGWSIELIVAEIRSHYTRGANRNPFDFLKISYRPPKRIDYLAALANQKARNKEQIIAKDLEGYKAL